MDPSLALANGLSLRALADSVDDVVSWWGDRPWPGHWLTDDEERVLVEPDCSARPLCDPTIRVVAGVPAPRDFGRNRRRP
jgi:hypothetical protein